MKKLSLIDTVSFKGLEVKTFEVRLKDGEIAPYVMVRLMRRELCVHEFYCSLKARIRRIEEALKLAKLA